MSVHQRNLVDHNIEVDHMEELSDMEASSVVGGGTYLATAADGEDNSKGTIFEKGTLVSNIINNTAQPAVAIGLVFKH